MLELSRWCARAALLGGALSVVEGLLILSNPEYYDFDSPLELLVLVVEGAVLLAALGGLVGLHVLQSASYGRWGVVRFLAASGGPALAGAGGGAGRGRDGRDAGRAARAAGRAAVRPPLAVPSAFRPA